MRAVTLTSYREVASYVGLDPYPMLKSAHLTPEMIAEPENRIPAQSVCELLEESARASKCSTFGLAMAECRTFASLGPLSLLLDHLGNISEVIDALTEYRRHLNDVIILGVEEESGEKVLRVELVAKYATPQTADLALGVAYIALRGASRYRWQPLEVHFTHPAPDDFARFNRFFAVPICFGSAFNGFSCSPDSMTDQWPWANVTMAGHARQLLTLVKLVPNRLPISESVMRVISLALPAGRASLAEVARNMGKSGRSLQRSLAREGRGFGDLLNEVRRSLVVQHLSSDNCSITWVGAMLGFHSSSSFTRWFIAEFGVAPRIWRSEQMRAVASRVL
jgi:AraC-like DNA-binding protein